MSAESRHAEIARVAQDIWEAEGRPEGRAEEHWRLAEERLGVRSGQAAGEVTGAAAAPRPVQAGFEDAAPGMVPDMKSDPAPEIEGDAGGRFARQLADAPRDEDDPAPAGENARAGR